MSGNSSIGYKKTNYSRFMFKNKKKTKTDRNIIAEQHAGLLRGLYFSQNINQLN